MFTDKAQAIVDRAKDYAHSAGDAELGLTAMLSAILWMPQAGGLLSDATKLPVDKLAQKLPPRAEPQSCPGKLPLSEQLRMVLGSARQLAEEVPDRLHPGLVGIAHLVAAMSLSSNACALLGINPIARSDAAAHLAAWQDREAQTPRLDELVGRLRQMRTELLARIYGQDHAVHAFVEGVFNAEVAAAADSERKAPRALFVFAGPPGVGKTFLAEQGASHLQRPFRRFDMSAYSGHQQSETLVGFGKTYQGARPGILTEFVEKNPNAVLLFDEIEKAHINTVQLFLQILDNGTLEDKFHDRPVSFRDCTIIFTTNAGKKLYDSPNQSGVHSASSAFHRQTILDALQNETDPRTNEPCFPQAICSRMATGYPVLFNHLGVGELERVVEAELKRVGGLLEKQYYKRISFDPLLPTAIVLREGARADARMLRSQAETFVKTEIFKFCQLFHTNRLEEVFAKLDRVEFTVDLDLLAAEGKRLFHPDRKPLVLLIADPMLAGYYIQNVKEVDWVQASDAKDAMRLLGDGEKEVDLVLLDLWISRAASTRTMHQFDKVPAAARGLDAGQELLRQIHQRLPGMPVYLLSLEHAIADPAPVGAAAAPGAAGGAAAAPAALPVATALRTRATVDDELLLACVRGGGARGMIASRIVDANTASQLGHRDRFAQELVALCGKIHRQKMADQLGRENQVLTFDTAPLLEDGGRVAVIRVRNLRMTRALAAADAGEVLDDVERPRTRFDDVIGATTAKDELRFFIDFLKNPRRFASMGMKPPKGVLLHGPPGTGKTMLARAMAGESNVAFIPVSATSFVTVWQGSGPENVKKLFDRARRYAPAIIFIDEIDAIGKSRIGGISGQAEESTLNALLVQMDGFTGPAPDRPVFILAATNFSLEEGDGGVGSAAGRTLDPALVRRFSRTILVGLPEKEAREKYLALRLKGRPNCTVQDSAIKLVAERSAGMSIANLEMVVETAVRNAVKGNCALTNEVLEKTFEEVIYGEARARDVEQVRRTARHEAGHTIMYWLSGRWAAYVTVVSRGDHGGYMAPAASDFEQRGVRTREDLLADIRVSLAGRAAEIVYYGKEAGLTTGASGDIEHASKIARAMVCYYGMDDECGLLRIDPHPSDTAANAQVNKVAARILKEQMELTVKLMAEHRAQLNAVAEALVERERLTTEDLKKLLPDAPRAV